MRMSFLSSIAWYARRLQAMNPAEVRHRLEERWRKITEPNFLKGLESFDLGPANHKSPKLPDQTAAPMDLRAQLGDDARRLQSGKWQLFGWREVDVGAPPCWHRDAFCGVVIDPEKPAQRINHRHLPDGADARTIWEINRWSEMTRLAMHGWLNEDVSALRTAQSWLEDWCERNPPGYGINWTSPLEVALRLLNFTWLDAMIHATGGEGLRATQLALAKRLVPAHAAWIWRYRSAGSSANNHLLGELAALVVAVTRWPSLTPLACSAEEAWDLLGHEVLHQFAKDGGSREQALHYHLFAFDLAWQAALAVGCKAGDVHERLKAAADYFAALVACEEPWDFGDNDDAQVLPVTQVRAHAAREWQAWFRGEAGSLRYWLGPAPQIPAPSRMQLFSDSGMAVVADHDWKVRLDGSPLGFGALAAHGHGDALHASVWDGEEALLIDPGTGGYYGHPELRGELAAWQAHNGPVPQQGFRTPKRMGSFLWAQHHATPIISTDAENLQVTFLHEGHQFRRSVSITRDVLQIQDGESTGKAFQVRWIFSPKCQVKAASAGMDADFILQRGGREWLLKVTGHLTADSLAECRVSPAYGCIEMAPCLTVTDKSGQISLSIRRKR